jgi:hypothetical protein
VLGFINDINVIKAEKKITALATADSREKSILAFSRHSIEPGYAYVIVEDVCNNFSTTDELVYLIHSAGGKVLAIVCFLDRSPPGTLSSADEFYSKAINLSIPVVSLVREPIAEYKQDDPAVAEDVARGNVVWKPKDEWNRLSLAVRNAKMVIAADNK